MTGFVSLNGPGNSGKSTQVRVHIDVTLWFVLMGDRAQGLCVDEREARSVEWLAIDDPAVWVGHRPDPQTRRFLSELTTALTAQSGVFP